MNYTRPLTKLERKLQEIDARFVNWCKSLTNEDLILLSWSCILFLLGVYLYIFEPVLKGM